MTFFTIKNIGLLLLLGVLVFPVGINQSYAQQFDVRITEPSTSPITPDIAVSTAQGESGVISFTAITDDSTSFEQLDITLDFVNDDVTNPASNLDTQVIFVGEDIGRTGGPSDPDVTIMGETVGFTVNDNAIVGVYNLEYTVTDTDDNTSTGRLIFTIIQNTAPTAENFNIQILPRTTATIPFDEIISDIESLFSGLEIEFSFVDTDLSTNQITVTSGATVVDGSDGMATFTVTAEDVVITEESSQFSPSETRTIELTYTVTDTGGLSDTGTVNIFVVETIIPAFDGNLDDRYFTVPITPLPVMFTRTFDGAQYRDLLNHETTFGLASDSNPLDVMVSPIATGPNGGTATFTNNGQSAESGLFIATLTYTPAVNFIGIETFTYTGTLGRVIASGTLTFYVGVTCEIALNANVDFGELGVGVTSNTSLITITNEGDVPAQSLIAGANWVSVEDDSISTMDVGQTRYSVTLADPYDTRTAFTATPVNVGGEIAESASLDVFVQLFVELIDETFRGLNTPTTQTITVTYFCSMDP